MSDKTKNLIPTAPDVHYAFSTVPTFNMNQTSLRGEGGPSSAYSPTLVEQYLSASTVEIMQKIHELETDPQATPENIFDKRVTLDEKLFDARASVKILMSKVSMHFSETLRKKLFRQIDLMHDAEDWDEDDKPIQSKSFSTFLRWFYLNKPLRLPNFGLSATGNFIASWLTNQNRDRLVLEFMSNDRIRWFVTKCYGDDTDHSSGLTKLSRISDVLAPFHSEGWFEKEI